MFEHLRKCNFEYSESMVTSLMSECGWFCRQTGKHNLKIPYISGNLNAAEEEDGEYGLRCDIHRVPLIFMRHEALQRRCRLACKLLGIWLCLPRSRSRPAIPPNVCVCTWFEIMLVVQALYLVARILQAC